MKNLRMNSLFWFNEVLALMGVIFWVTATFFIDTLDFILLFSPNEIESVSGSEAYQLGWGLTGAILVGWAFTLHAVNQQGIEGIFSSKNMLYLGISSWFIMDTTTSIITGFYYNAIGNVIFLVLGTLAIRSSLSD